jgi:hypothetical protein
MAAAVSAPFCYIANRLRLGGTGGKIIDICISEFFAQYDANNTNAERICTMYFLEGGRGGSFNEHIP